MGERIEHWSEAETRAAVRIFGEVGAHPPHRRAAALLHHVGRWLHAERWELRQQGRLRLHHGSPASPETPLFLWLDDALEFTARRAAGFNPRRAELAKTLLDHADWLGEALEVRDPSPSLRRATRHTEVLNRLMAGESRKQIAENCGISINTVSGYVRDLYRLHGVSSQTLLIQKVTRESHHPPTR